MSDVTIEIKITGPLACGKSYTLGLLEELLENDCEVVARQHPNSTIPTEILVLKPRKSLVKLADTLTHILR